MAVSSAKEKVIDVDQKKDQAQHRALRDSGCDWDRV